jgi:hypothetical protein
MLSHARTPLSRQFLGLAALGVSAALLLATPARGVQEPQDLLTYVRAGAGGAKAYNLPDPQAVVVLEAPAETVLAVHAKRSGWLDVEAPGGFRVWVWGEYLEPASKQGMVRVTGNDVRMRPLASSGIESYALAQKLGRGQELYLIGRKDESLPMTSDWVQVWSPPGARAWVREADTDPLAGGESGAELWGAAVSAKLAARKPVPVTPPAPAGGDAGQAPVAQGQAAGAQAVEAAAPAGKDAVSALRRAETLFASEMAKDDAGSIPDYGAVRAAYEEVLVAEQDGPSAARARSRLEEVGLRAEAYRLRHELELERARREAEARAARERIEQAGDRDPFYGRFDTRGWLERRIEPGTTEPFWVLRWSGEDTAELVCFSGRYDLSVFEGFELGVNGQMLSGPIEATAGRGMRAARFDVRRIEVLSGRSTQR